MTAESTIICETADDAIELGIKVGRMLQPGMVLCLDGSLGAGKTTFSKGVARALGIEDEITSPTFTIVSEYPGRIKLYHMDMYRIEDEEELTYIGFTEMIESGGLTLIEWGEKFSHLLPEETVFINIKILENQHRQFTIEGLIL